MRFPWPGWPIKDYYGAFFETGLLTYYAQAHYNLKVGPACPILILTQLDPYYGPKGRFICIRLHKI